MKLSTTLLSLLALGASFGAKAETVPYSKLVEFSKQDSAAPGVVGKTVQVNVVGKGEIGYFAKSTDQTTFACDSGDKALTSYKRFKGTIEGTIVKSQSWEGSIVYSLKDCQFVKPGLATVSTVAVAAPSMAKKRIYEAGGKSWQGTVQMTGDDRSAKVSMESENERGGTCTVAGTASYSGASTAVFKASDDAECTADLVMSGDTLKVKSRGCSSYCGGSAPGFDYAYKLKH